MILMNCFIIALVVSFLGSIPPGSINISVMQYAMQNKKVAALYFALAVSLVEFVYAGFAVKFQFLLTQNTFYNNFFQILSCIVLIILGFYNLLKKEIPKPEIQQNEKRNGFKKGILIALANPLAIPFWLMVTTYLQSMQWVILNDGNFLIYVAGISAGTFLLLTVVIWLGTKFSFIQHNKFIIYRIPGITFILMGIYTYYQ